MIIRSFFGACARVAWHAVPLSMSVKLRVKDAVFRRLTPLLRGTQLHKNWVERNAWKAPGVVTPGPSGRVGSCLIVHTPHTGYVADLMRRELLDAGFSVRTQTNT